MFSLIAAITLAVEPVPQPVSVPVPSFAPVPTVRVWQSCPNGTCSLPASTIVTSTPIVYTSATPLQTIYYSSASPCASGNCPNATATYYTRPRYSRWR